MIMLTSKSSLLFTAVLCLLISSIVAWSRGAKARRFHPGRIDCEKYVYAPPCRGVSAKRAIGPDTTVNVDRSPISDTSVLEKAILRNVLALERSKAKLQNTPRLIGLLSQTQEEPEWSAEELFPAEWSTTGEDLNSV